MRERGKRGRKGGSEGVEGRGEGREEGTEGGEGCTWDGGGTRGGAGIERKRERKEAMTEAYSIHIHVTETDKQSCIKFTISHEQQHIPPQHIQAVYDVIFQRSPLQAEVLHLLLDGCSSSHTRVGGEAFGQ